MLCRIPLETNSSNIFAHFDYVAEAADPGSVGEGLCVYLIDPTIDAWDRDFTAAGPLGFVGKRGAVVGIGIDLAGNFCGEPNHVAIKSPAGDTLYQCALPCSSITPEDDWRDVSIKFDIDEHTCDMSIAGEDLFTGVKMEGISIPRTICIGVCAAANATHHAFITVNNISLVDHDDEDEDDVDGELGLASETESAGNELIPEADELLMVCRELFREATLQDGVSTPKSASRSGVDANEFGLAALFAGQWSDKSEQWCVP